MKYLFCFLECALLIFILYELLLTVSMLVDFSMCVFSLVSDAFQTSILMPSFPD